MNKKEILHFKVSSGLKDIIGKDLITNEIVAIFELVKNSFDANASRIEITINVQKNRIMIQDDGKGMGYDEIKNKWLFVAYSEKKHQNSKAAGSKGIGRFSCDRLGKKLELHSKNREESGRLLIDWEKFEEDDLNKFENLEVEYDKNTEESLFIDRYSGTTLVINELRDVWDKQRAEKIIKALKRLINPFSDKENININLCYIDQLGFPELNQDIENNILDILDNKTNYIHTKIDNNKITIELFDKEKKIYSVKLKNFSILTDVEYKIYYLNQSAKNNFFRIMKEHNKDYGSIFLYKNDFRIFPFGEPDYDSFGLNLRKTQGHSRYLAHRELLGWINIRDISNHFSEVTSRDRGFVENLYTVELEQIFYKLVQRPLEDYAQLVKFGKLDMDNMLNHDVDTLKKLISRFEKWEIINIDKYELPIFSEPINIQIESLTNPNISEVQKERIEKSILSKIANTEKELKQQEQEKKEIVKQIQSAKNESGKTLKKLEQAKRELEIKNRVIKGENPNRQLFLEHDLNKVVKELGQYTRKINSKMKKDLNENQLKRYDEDFANFKRVGEKIRAIQKVVLKIDIDTKNDKEEIDVKAYIRSYFQECVNSEVKVDISFDDTMLVRLINVFDLGVVLDNLVINAEDNGATIILLKSSDDKICFVTDTGPIDVKEVNPIERMFDLGFSTKKYGTGYGLYIVKQIIEEFGWQITVSSINEMVEFCIFLGEEM